MVFNQLYRIVAVEIARPSFKDKAVSLVIAGGIVTRVAFNEIPTKVEYSLTEYAKELAPILGRLCEWGSRIK